MLYSIAAIATAESANGSTWTNVAALTQDAAAQLVTGAGSGWNRGSYGPVCLFCQPAATNTGTEPWNYRYVTYYDGTDGSHEAVGLAYSTDGLFGDAYKGTPVLANSGGTTWDANYTAYGTIYRDAAGFHFWYSGGSAGANDGIGYAASVDGKTWVKTAAPIFHITDGVPYRAKRVYTPSVADDGTGTLKMLYSAQAITGPRQIGLAVSNP